MLTIGKILLCLIIFYEVYRIVKRNDFIRVVEILREQKGLEKGSPELLKIGSELLDNKRYLFIIGAEYVYLLFTIILLFTPYFWVAILLGLQGIVAWLLTKGKVNKHNTYIDSLVSIVIIITGFILI